MNDNLLALAEREAKTAIVKAIKADEFSPDYHFGDKVGEDEVCIKEFVFVGDFCFNVWFSLEWEICNYREWADECDYDFTGELLGWRVLAVDATHYDEDTDVFTPLEIPESVINEINKAINKH